MDVGRVGSLFIRGPEPVLQGRDMVLTLTLKRPIDARALFASYETLVQRNLSLRSILVADRDSFAWAALSARGLKARLARERTATQRSRTLDSIHTDNSAHDLLPLRYAQLDARTLAVFVDHALANGYGALAWIDAWLRIYAGEDLAPMTDTPAPRAGWPVRTWRAVARLFWTLAYVITFVVRAGRRAAIETVDLTRGKTPEVHTLGYAARTFRFSQEETTRVVASSKASGATVTEAMCVAVATALFAAQPDKRRVLLSLPVDLGAHVDGFSRYAPGNYTGSLIVQLFRDRPLDAQVRAALLAMRRGVPFGLASLVAAFAKTERALFDRFASQARMPIAARAPFENFSCAVSSLGVLHHAAVARHVETISAHGMTQTVFFCAMTLGGRLSFELAVANDLFDASETFRLGDAIRDALLQPDAATEPTPLPLAARSRGLRAIPALQAEESSVGGRT